MLCQGKQQVVDVRNGRKVMCNDWDDGLRCILNGVMAGYTRRMAS